MFSLRMIVRQKAYINMLLVSFSLSVIINLLTDFLVVINLFPYIDFPNLQNNVTSISCNSNTKNKLLSFMVKGSVTQYQVSAYSVGNVPRSVRQLVPVVRLSYASAR